MTDKPTEEAAQPLRYIGKPQIRGDTVEKVTGTWTYGTDLKVPGMLYAKVLRSPYPHARIVSVDVSRARQLKGVRVVITGEDVSYLFGSAVRDEPCLARGKVRYAGEAVAAVAAVSEEIAREAVDLIDVEYEELPAVFDPLQAMEPDAPVIHEDMDQYVIEGAFTSFPGTNIISHTKIRRGDIEQGFGDSDLVYEDVFTTQYIHTCPMEPHNAVAQFGADGGITLWSSTQSPYNFVRDLGNALGVPYNRIRVICTGVGGGFGSKSYLRIEPLAVALAMHASGAPVKYAATRDEEFTSCTAKHPTHLTFKTGVKRDGTIVARKITGIFNTGGYADTGPLVSRNGAFSGTGPYRIPNVWIDNYCVYTNNPLGGAFRGFGVPQLTRAHESQMDMIAHRLDISPVEIRMRNLFDLGDSTCTGEVLTTSVGVKDTLRQAVEVSGYDKPVESPKNPKVARGRGLATMHKLTNTPSTSNAIIKMHQDGSVNLLCSTIELGQGIYTALRQIVAERLGIDMDHVRISPPDTSYTPFDQSTSGSRSVFHMGNALVRAGDDLTSKLCEMAAPLLDCPVDSVEYREGAVWRKDTNYSLSCREIIQGHFGARGATVQGDGSFTPPSAKPPDKETGQSPKASAFWMYATQVADVEVDLETGKITVLKVVAAHDAGKIINPKDAEGQLEGGVVQGVGATLYEEMVVNDGVVTNPTFAEYKIPSAMDIPDIVAVFVETSHDGGPYGAKGLGEPVLAPTSPAIANAVFNATGARITSLPITPEKVLRALKDREAAPLKSDSEGEDQP
jgi:carbon-monoxide dehydrogenase large subunit